METYRRRPYGLVRRVERPALAKARQFSVMIPPTPWTTAEKVGVGLFVGGTAILTLCALKRAAEA